MSVAASAAMAVTFAVLMLLGHMTSRGFDTLIRAAEYEREDSIRHSPSGGYYGRSEEERFADARPR